MCRYSCVGRVVRTSLELSPHQIPLINLYQMLFSIFFTMVDLNSWGLFSNHRWSGGRGRARGRPARRPPHDHSRWPRQGDWAVIVRSLISHLPAHPFFPFFFITLSHRLHLCLRWLFFLVHPFVLFFQHNYIRTQLFSSIFNVLLSPNTASLIPG